MGRTVDLHYLISQRINTMLLRSLDVAISRFEALGFTAIVVSATVFVVLPINYNDLCTDINATLIIIIAIIYSHKIK